jgi:hypothetical protein
MANNNRNRAEIRGAKKALNQLKLEVANELGIQNYDQLDKGNLPARLHGKIGGNMVRKMIEFAEVNMRDNQNALQQVANQDGPNEQDVQEVQSSLQAAAALENSQTPQHLQ